MHNQAHQFELKLEKHWATQTGYFQFLTSMLGIVITDAWKAYCHHLHKRNCHKNMEIEDFANLLAKDMLENKLCNSTMEKEVLFIPAPGQEPPKNDSSSVKSVLDKIVPTKIDMPASRKTRVATRAAAVLSNNYSILVINTEKDLGANNKW